MSMNPFTHPRAAFHRRGFAHDVGLAFLTIASVPFFLVLGMVALVSAGAHLVKMTFRQWDKETKHEDDDDWFI